MSVDFDTEMRRRKFARAKKWLRPLPRRSNLHKYPVLKWFATSARRRDYLWSIHQPEMVRAIYIGWIIALIPMYGLQMITAFVACFIFRANCLLAMALQWITNPLTIFPILAFQYYLGHKVLSLAFSGRELGESAIAIFKNNDFWTGIKMLASGENIENIIASTLVGGLIIAIVGAFITAQIYKLYMRRRALVQSPKKS